MQPSIQTVPPERYVVLYDGHCKFCAVQMGNLVALARSGSVEAVDFQQPGALKRFPGLSHEACMEAMHLVTPDGRVYRGFEAAVQAVATRPVLGLLARVYYLPGIRQLCDRLYALVAAHRYRIMGRLAATSDCEGGTCSFHAHSGTARSK